MFLLKILNSHFCHIDISILWAWLEFEMVWKLKTGAIYGCIFSHSQVGLYSFFKKKKCFPFNLFVSVLNQLTLITEMESLCVVKEIKTPCFSVTMPSSEAVKEPESSG